VAFATWVVLFGSLAAAQGSAAVTGRVSLLAADGHTLRAPGVRLTLTCGALSSRFEISDERGEFRFANLPAGTCSIVADLQGFKSSSATAVTEAGEVATVEFHLDIEPVYTGLTVTGERPAVLHGRCRKQQRSADAPGSTRSTSRCSK
jgi:hypothetical protein